VRHHVVDERPTDMNPAAGYIMGAGLRIDGGFSA
jgi:hypothetical protein